MVWDYKKVRLDDNEFKIEFTDATDPDKNIRISFSDASSGQLKKEVWWVSIKIHEKEDFIKRSKTELADHHWIEDGLGEIQIKLPREKISILVKLLNERLDKGFTLSEAKINHSDQTVEDKIYDEIETVPSLKRQMQEAEHKHNQEKAVLEQKIATLEEKIAKLKLAADVKKVEMPLKDTSGNSTPSSRMFASRSSSPSPSPKSHRSSDVCEVVEDGEFQIVELPSPKIV